MTLGIPVELTQGEISRGLRINGKICGELVGQVDEEGDHTQDQKQLRRPRLVVLVNGCIFLLLISLLL